VVRTHREVELSYLERQGVGMAVMGERELALSMMNYALRSLGLSETRARLVVQGFRTIIPGVRSRKGLAIIGLPEALARCARLSTL
jgi:monovalent cation:H+ antiporter-2, CPA2 family